jgi:acyl carrier protein
MAVSESKLKQVIADVFGIEIETIGEDTSVDTVQEWDSLKHLNLVLVLESEFDVSLSEEQTVQILSYPLIKAILEEHGINFIE